ncbi:MAG: class I SAM-dependent methyltransferase [Candidatus Thorarchaeota archaeon]
MTKIVWPSPLYDFLRMIETSSLEKKILDCGAGGPRPPLMLFANRGYETHGIDISPANLEAAKGYAKSHGVKLNLTQGDMRDLPYDDESFSFIYTYNSICHLSKMDTAIAINEMKRVLRKDGYLFVDFMSTECSYCGIPDLGEEKGKHEYEYIDEEGADVLHCFYDDTEPDSFFDSMTILIKKKTITEHLRPGRISTDVWLRYFVQKQ